MSTFVVHPNGTVCPVDAEQVAAHIGANGGIVVRAADADKAWALGMAQFQTLKSVWN